MLGKLGRGVNLESRANPNQKAGKRQFKKNFYSSSVVPAFLERAP